MKPAIAVQLFTLRDACERDFDAALERVAGIGFKHVEFGGFHGRKPEHLRKTLDRLSLKAVSAHIGLDRLTDDVAGVAEDARALGLKYVVCPGIFEEKKLTEERYEAVAEILQTAGEKLAGDGFQLAYHNHAFEFDFFGGKMGFELLAEATDPKTLQFEIDTYWVNEAGIEPCKFIEQVGRRCPILHLKDRAADGTFSEVGSGTIDFASIFEVAEAIGVDVFVVEQDSCARDPFDCIATSLKFLQSKGY